MSAPVFSDTTRRRLWMRSIRRGIKEMDVILSRFAAERLSVMSDAELAGYEALLEENDQSLYAWVIGQEAAPSQHAAMIGEIAASAGSLFAERRG